MAKKNAKNEERKKNSNDLRVCEMIANSLGHTSTVCSRDPRINSRRLGIKKEEFHGENKR